MSDEPTVYIVDDHEAVRDSLSALLQVAGLKVEIFGSAQEFLEAVDPQREGCLLLDLRLPDMSGIEVQRRLSDMKVRLRTIMISGHGDIPLAVKAIKAGAVDFIEKPFRDEQILGHIRRILEPSERPRAETGRHEEIARLVDTLTPREREVLEGLVAGQPNKQIAHELGISPRTVEIHRARVMTKMEARSLSHLVRMAIVVGIGTDLL